MRQRILAAFLLSAAGLSVSADETQSGFRFMNAEHAASIDATRELDGLGQSTTAAMWIWADKNVYQANEPLTLRWTIKANNDFYPYTIFAFRQNNQTGARTFLPGGTSTPTDIFGNTAAQGYRITALPTATKQVLVGPGGLVVPNTISIPNELGMHTIVVQLRDFTGGRIIKSAYWKIGVVSGFESLPALITANRTLTNTVAYRVSGMVTVTNNAVLTIEPGTFIIGQPGSQPPSVLLISTAGRLIANGTRSRPIIMTSSQPIGRRQRGDWGGFIMLGKSQLNVPGGTANIEGLPNLPETVYGGTDTAHNCGSLRYVRVEFAGALLRPNEETNSFTWGACGSQTVGEYLQAHYGLDDSFEWFGGTNDNKYLVGTYGADDYFDWQLGTVNRVQFAVAVANDDLSNRGIESDNNEQNFQLTPRTIGRAWNLTFVGGGDRAFDEVGNAPCIFWRRGTGFSLINTLCFHWITRTIGGANFDSLPQGTDLNMNGLVAWNNGRDVNPPRANTLADQVVPELQTFAGEPSRQLLFANPMLRRPLERSDPDFRPMPGSPLWNANWIAAPDNGFFESAPYVGAFGNVDWTEEWTTFHQEQDIAP
jgi:hypothetical protein